MRPRLVWANVIIRESLGRAFLTSLMGVGALVAVGLGLALGFAAGRVEGSRFARVVALAAAAIVALYVVGAFALAALSDTEIRGTILGLAMAGILLWSYQYVLPALGGLIAGRWLRRRRDGR